MLGIFVCLALTFNGNNKANQANWGNKCVICERLEHLVDSKVKDNVTAYTWLKDGTLVGGKTIQEAIKNLKMAIMQKEINLDEFKSQVSLSPEQQNYVLINVYINKVLHSETYKDCPENNSNGVQQIWDKLKTKMKSHVDTTVSDVDKYLRATSLYDLVDYVRSVLTEKFSSELLKKKCKNLFGEDPLYRRQHNHRHNHLGNHHNRKGICKSASGPHQHHGPPKCENHKDVHLHNHPCFHGGLGRGKPPFNTNSCVFQ
jgi:hypothetical protein